MIGSGLEGASPQGFHTHPDAKNIIKSLAFFPIYDHTYCNAGCRVGRLMNEGVQQKIIPIGLSSKLASGAAVSMLLCMLLPCVSLQVSFLGGSLNGEQVVGWVGWVTFLVFALAALTRFAPVIIAYKNLLDLAAFTMLVVTILYAVLGSPVAQSLSQAAQFSESMQQEEANNSYSRDFRYRQANQAAKKDLFSTALTPQPGLIFFVMAPLLLVVARRRERI